MTAETSVDWATWLARWDARQTGYIPQREERFAIMLDVLDVLYAGDVRALDLACGPGAISQRLLMRFPGAISVAVDTDPVMLAVGQGALGDISGRLRWAIADLTDAGWTTALEGQAINVDSVRPRCTGCRQRPWCVSTGSSPHFCPPVGCS